MAIHTLNLPQVAQQAAPKQVAHQAASTKTQPSRFDQAMATTRSQPSTQTHAVRKAAEVTKADRTDATRKAGDVTKVAQSKRTEMGLGVQKLLSSVEQGQVQMEKILKEAMSGRKFSPQELLALQAGVYRYAQELELTSKVVEKATSGVKDTLKTQV